MKIIAFALLWMLLAGCSIRIAIVAETEDAVYGKTTFSKEEKYVPVTSSSSSQSILPSLGEIFGTNTDSVSPAPAR